MTASANARDQIRIVGSSTVFPFAIAVAEEFGYTTGFKTPVVESTGSGGGLKLFCAGVGVRHPDITNASRRIKESEIDACAQNGVTEIIEVKIGFDGIVIANSKRTPRYELTLKQIFTALAKEIPADGGMIANPYSKWSEIDPSLPDAKIEVFGPPPTSGTRDAFVELAMEGGCKKYQMLAALKKQDKNAFKAICHTIREDGAFVEAGENDNLIVQKLEANPNALGVFGFSFLDQNLDRLQGSRVEGVDPELDSIADGSYAISRSMYFYVKGAHVGVIPGIEDYIDVFTQEATWGDEGFLTDLGLIPLPASERVLVRDGAMALEKLSF
ncbi:MAG: PstS family phosphate ABC transporter substrate-binding protein [Proteobacteria bacterium]|nr:PstS family phosphate ABC transporter substrate-binding protein [Pseudomonadota bacterium]